VDPNLVITLDSVATKLRRETMSTSGGTVWHNVFIPKDSRLPVSSGAGRILGLGPNPDGVARMGGAMGYQPDATGNFSITDWEGRNGPSPMTGHMAVVFSPTTFEILRMILE